MVIYVAHERDMAGVGHARTFSGVTCLGWQTLTMRIVDVRCAYDALVVAGLAERVAQPFETLVQTVTRCGASGLDVLEALLARHCQERVSLEHTQARCRRLWRPSLSVISAAFMAF